MWAYRQNARGFAGGGDEALGPPRLLGFDPLVERMGALEGEPLEERSAEKAERGKRVVFVRGQREPLEIGDVRFARTGDAYG